MSEQTDLIKRLNQSVSQKSLMAEQRIVTILRNHSWPAEQGVYYTDIKTSKVREIDIIGRQSWEKKLKAGDLSAWLFLLIEAKSTADYHIIFSDSHPQTDLPTHNDYWVGYDDHLQDAIVTLLTEAGLSTDNISKTAKQLIEIAFPQYTMRTAPLRIPPMSAPMYSSAFRETNIGVEKDLDNSVLWRALTALHSAVESIKRSRFDNILEDIDSLVKSALLYARDPVEVTSDIYHRAATHIDLFHPIVVTESKIWSSSAAGIEEVNWCRFVQLLPYGAPDWWADVVRADYFESYVEDLIQHYETSFRKSRAKNFRKV